VKSWTSTPNHLHVYEVCTPHIQQGLSQAAIPYKSQNI